jgi:hypothetical protein
MHIELTDHLRCPAAHEEAFLVLLPDRMNGRRVLAGHLGCPVCGWATTWTEEIPRFGPAPTLAQGQPAFDAAAALTLLGVDGPGGWLALAGRTAHLAGPLAELLPGVALVAINPPPTVRPDDRVSVIEAATWPLKRHALRGVLLGADSGLDSRLAVGSVLPGLRAVGEGAAPALVERQTLLAESDDAWVVAAG